MSQRSNHVRGWSNNLEVGQKRARRKSETTLRELTFGKQVNATAFRQWRSWLRGADLNRRPLGYAI